MANGTIDEEDQDAIDSEPVSTPAPTVVAPPGASPVTPPQPAYNPELVGQNIAIRQMLMSEPDATMAQAEQAVATALKFQAIRGYQKDLANGVAASDALTKWAPIMFSQPKAATMGQAASLVRASRPSPPKPISAGGRVYSPFDPANPNAQLRQISPEAANELGPPTAVEIPGQPGYFATKSATGKGYTIHPKRPSLEDIKQMTPQAASALATHLPELAGTFGTNWVNEITPTLRKRIGEGFGPRPGVAAPRGAAPTAIRPPAAATSTVTTKAQYDALPSGAVYVGKNGRRYRKP